MSTRNNRQRCLTTSQLNSRPSPLRTTWRVPNVKVAVNTIDPRSPFFSFCAPKYRLLQTQKIKCGRMSASMKWRYLGHLQLLSKAKHSSTAMAKKEVCPQDEIADPSGTANTPIDRHGFAEGLVSFRKLRGVQSSLVRFAPNRAIAWGPPQWQALLETLCVQPYVLLS